MPTETERRQGLIEGDYAALQRRILVLDDVIEEVCRPEIQQLREANAKHNATQALIDAANLPITALTRVSHANT